MIILEAITTWPDAVVAVAFLAMVAVVGWAIFR